MSVDASTRVAVVGYGYWGAKHVRVLGSVPGVKVTIVDTSEARRAEAAACHPYAEVVADLADALGDLDAVVVCTPPSTHAAVASTALSTGAAVLVEKPLATSVSDAEHLVRLASEHRVPLMVGHTFEYNVAVHKLKEIVDSGALGRILYIDTARLSLGRYQPDVDVVWDLAPHDISILSYVMGTPPGTVAAWTQRNVDGQHADVAYLRLEFPGVETHAVVHVSWLDPCKVRRVTVVGDRKMVVYNDLSDNERLRIYDIGVDCAAPEPGPTHALPVSYRTGDITSPYLSFSEPLMIQDAHFIECVRTGRRPRTPGERGLEIVRVLEAADLASASGNAVSVDSFATSELLVPDGVAS
jgi:predicted dehydrogenase